MDQFKNSEILVQNLVDSLKFHIDKSQFGNFLVPVPNALFFLDLIDLFRFKLVNYQKIHIIGCTYDEILGYSNANVEFVNSTLSKKVYTREPENPFNAADLLRQGKLVIHKTIEDFQS